MHTAHSSDTRMEGSFMKTRASVMVRAVVVVEEVGGGVGMGGVVAVMVELVWSWHREVWGDG